MSNRVLEYPLFKGYVHNWLTAGPHDTPISNPGHFAGEDFKHRVVEHYYDPDPRVTKRPTELESFTIDNTVLKWSYYCCRGDHFVDLSNFYHTHHYLQSWAYAQIVCPDSQSVTFVLTTNGPADVWLNGQHAHRQEHFCTQNAHSVSFQAELRAGNNDLLVRFEEVAVRACPYTMALQAVSLPEGVRVCLPTANERTEQRRQLEKVFGQAYLDREVYTADDHIVLQWPEKLAERCDLTVRLQSLSGRIYAELTRAEAPAAIRLRRRIQVPDGAYQVVLMPRPEVYYEQNLRVQRRIDLHVLDSHYSQSYYGSNEERRREALEHAARQEDNLFAEIAKMALGHWSDVDTSIIAKRIEHINRRADCSDFDLVGLLGMMYRHGSNPVFPADLSRALEACILGFKYWMDEPGDDAMCYWTENHQILFHTCEILAGQLYGDRIFSNVGKSGQWHREKGERMALAWLHKRGTGGFQEWDSNCYLEEDILALAHLADLARTPQVREMAAVVLDKLLFTMSLNSYRGTFGSSHGRTYAPYIKGGRLEPTSGIGRLLWGMGNFNQRILGSVSLACAETYEIPALIQAVALDQPEALWSKERHAGEFEPACDLQCGSWEVNKVTYKTPDYMLASAQDYQPGQAGYQQHIWQATLGPDAVVFVTHPPCFSENGAHRPNFWHGNKVLPRVAQWKDVLVAIHHLPEDDWLGFTHAYFPIYTFDDYTLRQGWVFADKGDGYIALTAAKGLELVRRGDNAYRELRSHGHKNIWLCHMGRATQDGSFGDFQEAILAMSVTFDALSVQVSTLRGEILAFGWEGPLQIDGRKQPITGFKHYDSPYCVVDSNSPQMKIQFQEYAMRLHFALDEKEER